MNEVTTNILSRLHRKSSIAFELLPVYQAPDYQSLWKHDSQLYRAFTRKLISEGHPTRAFELAREGIARHSDDRDLQYLMALALARGGNVRGATTYVRKLLAVPDLDIRLRVEALSLEGRLFKDRFESAREPARRVELAAQSAACYRKAAALPGADSFPHINAATLTLLAEDRDKSRELAKKVIALAHEELQQPDRAEDYWVLATLGEAHFLLRELDKAADWYRQAVAKARELNDIGSIASMRRNALLIKEKLQVEDELHRLFYVGSVVVFSGHMIDTPTRARDGLPQRFPHDPQLLRVVSDAIKAQLSDLNATVGYSSAACGSDIMFAEHMLDRHAEVHIVLPFDRDDFYATSVDFRAPELKGWRSRFEAVMERATEVHYATREPYLADDVLFDFVNSFTQGLAMIRAGQRGVVPQALVVLDPSTAKHTGGTGYFVDTWERSHPSPVRINLQQLREEVFTARVASPVSPSPTPLPQLSDRLERQIKSMLFADVKGFSGLPEAELPRFFVRFLKEVDGALCSLKQPPVFRNTWGDGLYLVFDRVTDCAQAAVQLLQHAELVNWGDFGLEATAPVRIGMHAGPVFSCFDPIIGRTNYFGSHVNRAARIEPVTMPGCAFASEQFAALLKVESGHDFVCEYVGVEQLAKHYDRCPLYRLAQR
jgi:class 3 adenylate cyclase/tetratricopeptide (TPR) repeat protein